MEAEPEALRDAVLNGASLSDLEWMERQVDALFVQDADGRLVEWNSGAAGRPVPRFFLGSTRHGSLWRFRAGLDAALVRELARLAAAERPPVDLDALPERDAVIRERLAARAPLEEVFHGAAFRFPEEPAPETQPDVVELGLGDAGLLAEGFPELAASLAERAPCLAVVSEGRVAAVCYAATRPGAWVEAGVETRPGFRGRGLASRAVAAWARRLRAGGGVPLYSTSLANRGGLGVARRLGLIRYGSDLHMR